MELINKNTLCTTIGESSLNAALVSLMTQRETRERVQQHLDIKLPEEICFHGSRSLCAEIKVNEQGGESIIYATDVLDYAIFMALLELKNGFASVAFNNDVIDLQIDIDFVNGDSSICDGYVYILDKSMFVPSSTHEFISEKSVSVYAAIPVTFDDLEANIRVVKI